MKSQAKRWLPSPAMVVAIVALVAALAGSAVALQGKNSVKSNDIANNAVKTVKIAKQAVKGSKIANQAVKGSKIAKDAVAGAKIKNGSITAPDLDIFRNSFVPEITSTVSAPPVDLGGPSVTVTVPPGGLVSIFARVAAQATGGGADGAAQVHLAEPTFLPDAPPIMSFGTNNPIATRYTSPGTLDFDGVLSPTRGGMLTLAPPAGTYTFSLQYSQAGGATATFQNRSLWAGVIN